MKSAIFLSLVALVAAVPVPSDPPTFLPGAVTSTVCTGGRPCAGDMTYYSPAVGFGSCGTIERDSSPIVALPAGMMGKLPNPNNNPLCGRWIEIFNPATGKRARGKVTDTCPGCSGNSIDLSPGLFDQLGAESVGRYHGVQWHWV